MADNCASLDCSVAGSQSALAPAGRQAAALADLFWGMTIGTAGVWLVVVGLALYATYFSRRPLSQRGARVLIIGGGVVVPSVVLTGLLVYGLALLPELLAPAPPGALQVHVTGHQWWWRVRYPLVNNLQSKDGAAQPMSDAHVELANEIHLPVGRPVEFILESSDVIHSFWIPSLGGKVDMIPGRSTRLLLEPTQIGIYRGVCAEYCGTAHALMSFVVVVESEQDFERWWQREQQLAAESTLAGARRGAELFLSNGCGACHSVRGTSARGKVGPDLTHVGGRHSVGAGILRRSHEGLRHFVSATDEIKPGVHMPAFGMLPPEDLTQLATYLESLE